MMVKAMVDSDMLMDTVFFRLRDCEVAGGGLGRNVLQLQACVVRSHYGPMKIRQGENCMLACMDVRLVHEREIMCQVIMDACKLIEYSR